MSERPGKDPKDPILQAIELLRESGSRTNESIRETLGMLNRAEEERRSGVPLTNIVDNLMSRGGRESRQRAGAAIAEYERNVMMFRAKVIKELVDEAGMSFSEVGRRLRISRQMAARLYRSSFRTSP